MAAVDTNPAVQAVRLRLTRLSASGAPVTGTGNGFVSGGLIQLQDSPELDNGTDITVTLADGSKCVDVPGTPLMRWRNLELTICGVEDQHFEMLEGALLIDSAGSTIGHADPVLGIDAAPNGVALELWSKMIVGGSQDPTWPYLRSLYPKTFQWRRAQSTYLNGHLAWVFTGRALSNAGMRTTGPAGDWPDPASVGRVRAVVRSAAVLPAVSASYVAVA